ncbi:MAG TPA: ABC transporter permease, partial [Gemmatimonadales bacterium]|nr:ABC transporter permease [Gemmatimonadales bacterium]
ATLVALVVALGLGVAATVGAHAKASLATATSGDFRTTAGAAARRFRDSLVVAQVALAVMLLAGAGLLVRSLARLRQVNPGFEAAQLLTANVGLPFTVYETEELQVAFFHEFVARARTLPGVEAAGLVSSLPITGVAFGTSFWPADRPEPPAGQRPVADIRAADAGYFAAMRIPLLAGRLFDGTERAGAPQAIVVSQTLAREMWPGQDALGKQLQVNWYQPDADATVVGVVGDVRHSGLDVVPRPMIYYFPDQSPTNQFSLAVRGRAPPDRLAADLRNLLREMDPRLPLRDVRTMGERLDASVGGRRYPMVLLTLFAAVALTLAAIGLYGVLSYTVGLRSREIGVRIALGALPVSVMRMVVRRGLALVGVGLAIGMGGAIAATRVLQSLLYDVSPTDPMTLGLGAVVLAVAGVLASYLPARRAAGVDPMVALKGEG